MPGPESGTWIPDLDLNVCSLFLAVNIKISWFVLMLELSSRLQKTLENQSANLQANFGREGILSKHLFCSEKGFKVGNVLSLFTVNDPCQLSLQGILTCYCAQPSRTRKNYANREAHKKPVRKPPIRNAHICPCDSARYLNELCALIRRRTIQRV